MKLSRDFSVAIVPSSIILDVGAIRVTLIPHYTFPYLKQTFLVISMFINRETNVNKVTVFLHFIISAENDSMPTLLYKFYYLSLCLLHLCLQIETFIQLQLLKQNVWLSQSHFNCKMIYWQCVILSPVCFTRITLLLLSVLYL